MYDNIVGERGGEDGGADERAGLVRQRVAAAQGAQAPLQAVSAGGGGDDEKASAEQLRLQLESQLQAQQARRREQRREAMRVAAVVGFFVLAVLIVFFLWPAIPPKEAVMTWLATGGPRPFERLEWEMPPEIDIDPARERIGDVDIYWHAPPGMHGRPPHSVLLVFHGCGHGAKDWFELPEERRIVKWALWTGFMVVAPSSQDREDSKCWSAAWPPHANPDVLALRDALPKFFERESLSGVNTPHMYALGASSGGVFSTVFARVFPLVAQVVMVAPGSLEALSSHLPDLVESPATAFVYMPRDQVWASEKAVSEAVGILQSRRVEAVTFSCLPHPLTPTYLAERIDGVSPEFSSKFFQIAMSLGFLDPHGFLRRDPRRTELATSVLAKMEDEPEAVKHRIHLVDSVSQEMNVLFGEHEMTSEHFPTLLSWFRAYREE
jgi:dienelactone hydrolase